MKNEGNQACSWLFVPATRPERVAKAFASGADAVIVDLEDAVAPADKEAARAALITIMAECSPSQRSRLWVRCNAVGTPWHDADVQAIQTAVVQGLAGVVLSKAEHAADVAELAQHCGPACAIVPLIESVQGLDEANALARSPQVLRLAFGHLDFQVDAGLACDAQEAELVAVRTALVLASRRAGLPPPIDGVTVDTQDMQVTAADAQRSRRGGFAGKLCIHPAQVAVVNTAFAPSEKELLQAQRVLAAADASGSGVCTLDGRMVDAPVLHLARQTLAKALIAQQRQARSSPAA